MMVPSALESLAGAWSGTNRLWLEPGKPVSESETQAVVSAAAQGKFLTLRYTWSYEGQPQDGLLVIGQEAQPGLVKAFWIDSFHVGDAFMLFEGDLQADGAAQVKGNYAAPPGPDWGWQIRIEPESGASFRLVMHNITPDGEAFLAVEAVYRRQG